MSEQWPPEWDDPDAEDQSGDEQDTAITGHLPPDLLAAHLAEVTAALASTPPPVLPDAFAARISAAIAAEAATRTKATGAIGESATARSLSADSADPAAAGTETTTAPPASSRRARPRRSAGRGAGRAKTSPDSWPSGTRPTWARRRGLRPFPALGSLVVILVIAGLGFLIVHNGAGSNYSSSEAAAAPAASSFAAAAGAATGEHGSPSRPLNSEQQSKAASRSRGFVVRETGTRYEPATLAGQARAAVAATGVVPSPAVVPSAAGSADASASASARNPLSPGGRKPSAALAGCVSHLTGGQVPTLVDRASYAGRAAYIIVRPRRAWVVGLGCTAANPELITSVALTGLSGNLRALGSV